MQKLKRKSDGKVFDCSIVLDGRDLVVVYWENSWTHSRLDNFEPAVSGIDY